MVNVLIFWVDNDFGMTYGVLLRLVDPGVR